MRGRINTVFFVFVFTLGFLSAQNPYIDSLRGVLKNCREDSNKVYTLNDLGWELRYTGDFKQSMELSEQALDLAKKIKFPSGEAWSLYCIANVFHDQGRNGEAIKKYQEALKLYQQLKDDNFQGKVFSGLGGIYNEEGNYPKALECFLQNLKACERRGDQFSIATAYNNIGIVYRLQGNLDEALKYQLQGLTILLKFKDAKSWARSHNNIGNIYWQKGDFDAALLHHLEALRLRDSVSDQQGMCSSYSNIASVYFSQNNFQEALKYNLSALALAEKIGKKLSVANACLNLGTVTYRLGKYPEAKKYYDRARSLAAELKSAVTLKEVYYNLSVMDSSIRNWQAAFYDHKMFVLYRDSLLNEENTKKIVKAQLQYDFDKKHFADSLGNAERARLEEQSHQQQIREQKMYTYGGVGGFALMLIVAGVSVNAWRQKKKANLLISEQKSLVEEKQKEILDSISYAQRIQSAVLTGVEVWSRVSPEHFILFHPKDIVSGDFYWAHVLPNGRAVFALADCTGHGVPGGFMSMLGNSFLNELVVENKLFSAATILNRMRSKIIKALDQRGQGNQKDGMDMALCVWNKMENTLEFAGANNGIYVVRKGQLICYDGDKMPLGSYVDDEKPFTSHSIRLETGDSIFITTDGFPDQFGGPKGKKFKYKNLEELFVIISELPAENQQEQLRSMFMEWKGKLEQTDDVTVIGLKVV